MSEWKITECPEPPLNSKYFARHDGGVQFLIPESKGWDGMIAIAGPWAGMKIADHKPWVEIIAAVAIEGWYGLGAYYTQDLRIAEWRAWRDYQLGKNALPDRHYPLNIETPLDKKS